MSNNTHNQTGSFFSLLTDFDIYLFKSGRHFRLYEKLGAHQISFNNEWGVYFAVWAPNAESVSVIGNFNQWQHGQHVLRSRWDESGIWEGFFPHIGVGEAYKFSIYAKTGERFEKADPFAFYAVKSPNTASIVWNAKYEWSDMEWMKERKRNVASPRPISVYEVHLGSWKRKIEEGNRSLTYLELATDLVAYVKDMGYTHVEFLPVMEHPFYGSWGYQTLGYFAPTSRYGEPQDFKALIDAMHNAGIGVILDWVPSHFPGDAHGLYRFDGTHLYEHMDLRKGFHPDWSSYIFNFGRNEVRAFLISSAFYWLDRFHVDGLRVDAVASMLYLDYSRKEGEWEPNQYGGNENLEAISFLKEFNIEVYGHFPDTITIAEESTAWPGISHPTFNGGLGFGQKWMMGWMHDTLNYFKNDPIFRSYHQNDITFSLVYAFTENFMLPLSHDEVVHGKGSLIGRMPGDDWQKMANMRLMFSYMYCHPGTKLLFMGGEFAQYEEWNHENSLDWHLIQYKPHRGLMNLIIRLNQLYKEEPAMYTYQFEEKGFEWVDYSDRQNSVIVFLRKEDDERNDLLVVCNMTPMVHEQYKIGATYGGEWQEIFNSDAQEFYGSGVGNPNPISTVRGHYHGRHYSLTVTLPPLGVIILKLSHAIDDTFLME